jgi:hypothetical protein
MWMDSFRMTNVMWTDNKRDADGFFQNDNVMWTDNKRDVDGFFQNDKRGADG